MLNGAILIFGGNEEAQKHKYTEILTEHGLSAENNPDVLIIETLEDKRSVSIEQVRNSIKWLTQKPFAAKYKAVVFPQAQKITPEAQNTLLKTLEEPPSYATIILCSPTENAVLPTVQSRCQKIKLSSENNSSAERVGDSIEIILVMPIGERLSWAETESKEEKDDVLKLLHSWIIEERHSMINDPKVSQLKKSNLEFIIKVKNDLEKTNVNLRLALEHLVLNLI